MDEVQKLAAQCALRKMVADGWLSICTIDAILKMSGGIPSNADYQILRVLHCVPFADMPPELLRGLPLLVQRVLMSPGLEFVFTPAVRALAMRNN